MSNIPVWAMGYALRQAGVPCAEEIAVMLCRKKKAEPYAVDTFEAVGGSYVDTVYFNGDGKNEASTEFLVGEFPLAQDFEWSYHWGWDNAEPTKEAYLDLQITDLGWTPKVGDFVKLRYMLPKIAYCKFYNTETVQASMYKDPDYYTFEMTLRGSGDKSAVCAITHSTQNGVVTCYDNAQDKPQYYSSFLANRTFTPITEGNNLLGFELTGWLMCSIDSVRIKLTAHKTSAYNNAKLQVRYASVDDLTVEAYEIPIPKQPTSGTLVGYSYGGIVLPMAPDEVMAQPNVFLSHTETSDVMYGFTGTPSTWKTLYTSFVGSQEPCDRIIARMYNGAWEIPYPLELVEKFSQMLSNVVWANFDIYDTDGTLHIAASEPVPVYE